MHILSLSLLHLTTAFEYVFTRLEKKESGRISEKEREHSREEEKIRRNIKGFRLSGASPLQIGSYYSRNFDRHPLSLAHSRFWSTANLSFFTQLNKRKSGILTPALPPFLVEVIQFRFDLGQPVCSAFAFNQSQS